MSWVILVTWGLVAECCLSIPGSARAEIATQEEVAEDRRLHQDLIPRILERRHAIGSGRFHVIRTTGFPLDPESMLVNEYMFSVDGDRWARSFPMGKNKRVCKDGAAYTLVHTPQMDGTVYSSLKIEGPIGFADSESFNWAIYCGSLLMDSTAEFVGEQFEQGNWTVADATDEITVIVIPVQKDQIGKAFSGFTAPLFEGGSIELTVDRKLNGALSQIRFLGKNDEIGIVITAHEFQELAEGVWFPRLCEYQGYHAEEKPGFRVTYELISASLVNELIPDEDFQMELPLGTVVQESRTGKKPLRFRVDEQSQSLDEIMQKVLLAAPPVSERRISGLVMTVLVVAAFGSATWLFWRRPRGQPH